MTIKEEVINRLRRGDPFKEIRLATTSQSQFYRALNEFWIEAKTKTKEIQENLRKGKEEFVCMQTELKHSRREKEELSKDVEHLSQKKDKLTQEVAVNESRLAQLEDDVNKLEKKGFTVQIVKKLKQIEDRNGHNFLHRVEIVETLTQLETRVQGSKKEEASLQRKIRRYTMSLNEVQGKVTSERNRLDEMKVRTMVYRKAVDIVEDFLKDGYSVEDIMSLKQGLDTLQIKDEYCLSIARLVQGLCNQKTLHSQTYEIGKQKTQISQLNSAKIEAQGRLCTAEDIVKAVNKVRDYGITVIQETADSTRKAVESSQMTLDARTSELLSAVNNHIRSTLQAVTDHHTKVSESLAGLEIEAIDQYYSRIFIGILQNPEDLKQVPLSLVIQLFERLQIWIEMNITNNLSPSDILNFRLSIWANYNLRSMVQMIIEKLRGIMHQQS